MWCPKCKKPSPIIAGAEVKAPGRNKSNAVYVVDTQENAARKATRTCPKCGNEEAYQWFSSIAGEHAGVKGERTVEHYKCTDCGHLWSESR
jgi:DNA-directed RNA polymerase subunit M/transcription elongation factor TFIIS